MSVRVIPLLERLLQQLRGVGEIVLICFDADRVEQGLEVVGVERDGNLKLVLCVGWPVGCSEYTSQLVVRRGVIGSFDEKAAILLLGFGVVAVLELKVRKVETRVGILGIDCESFLVFGLGLPPVP